jgi:hypothetical protein
MSEFLAGKAVRKITTGIKVDTAINPIAAGANNLFTVVGGRVLMVALIGRVTTQIEAAATGCNVRIGAVALSLAGGLDITGDVVGTMYGITGTVGDAMYDTAGYLRLQTTPLVLNTGTVNLNNAGAGSTGAIAWSMLYVPIDDGAYVEAA